MQSKRCIKCTGFNVSNVNGVEKLLSIHNNARETPNECSIEGNQWVPFPMGIPDRCLSIGMVLGI